MQGAIATWNAIRLGRLATATAGSPSVAVGLIDGTPDLSHQAFDPGGWVWLAAAGRAHDHGTRVAGILKARRDSDAPGICPGCRILVRPVFHDERGCDPRRLAEALVECVHHGASVINLSAETTEESPDLRAALDHAGRNGVVVVAAGGNGGGVRGSAITGHPAVVPVVPCRDDGSRSTIGNLSLTAATRGLRAPGEAVLSLTIGGGIAPFCGSSAAAPLVTGVIALLKSAFPQRSAIQVKAALLAGRKGRRGLLPPLLNADAAMRSLE